MGALAAGTRERSRAGALAFAAAASAVLGVFAALRAPVLNPIGYLDPWFYTGTFTNFSYLFGTFHQGYWVTRLPWTIPGIVVNWLLPPLAAFFVLHIAFFVGGALFVFLLARRFYGPRIALVAATTLMLLPLWFDAHSTDYVDGPTMTYLFAATYFAVDPYSTGPRRRLRLAAGGFFAAAAFGTQIFSSVLIVGLVVVYVIVVGAGRAHRTRLVQDVAAAALGALVLLLVCGIVSRAYGGEFVFFMPSWRAGQGVVLSRWQRAGHVWMLDEPQLLIPAFLALVLLALVVRTRLAGRSWDDGLRFAAASFSFLAYLTVLLSVWEFWFGGDFFEVYYYFSLFLVPIAFALPACLHLLQQGVRQVSVPFAGVAIVLAAAPIVLVYGMDSGLVGRDAFYFVAAVMGAAIACAVVPARGHAAIVTFSTGFVAVTFATAYAGASGAMTQSVFGAKASTFDERRDVLTAAVGLERFMARNHLQSVTPPAFWYDGKDNPALDSVQSTYLWGITWIGREMPRLSPANRKLLEARRPPYVVLLCLTPRCAGGPAVLEHAGYTLRPKAAGTIGAGSERFYVRAFAIPKFLPHPILDFYGRRQSSFEHEPTAKALVHVDFAQGLPEGWTSTSKIRTVGGVPTFKTTDRPWNYEVSSPKLDLEPGVYRLYLRGRVVSGGIDIGILDADRNAWLSQREYWFRQKGFDRSWMTTPFQLSSATKVQIILSNWVPSAKSSRWRLQDLRLVRAG